MAIISNFKKIKKGRNEELFFSYSVKTSLIRLWNDNLCIQFQEEKIFEENICCLFSELWSKIKNCKAKDVIGVKKKGTEYVVTINAKNAGTIGYVIKECPWKIDSDDIPLLSVFGKTQLAEIAKAAEKQILNLDIYESIQYLHCKEGNLYINNLASIERFSPVYLTNSKEGCCGFKRNFSVKPVYFKNIDLISTKEVNIEEYFDRIVIFKNSNFLIIKKQPLLCDVKDIFGELKGNSIDATWDLTKGQGKDYIKEGLTSTDKSILYMANFKKNGNIYANGSVIGTYSGADDFNISLKECLDGLNTDWYKMNNYVFFNLDKKREGKVQKVFKI